MGIANWKWPITLASDHIAGQLSQPCHPHLTSGMHRNAPMCNHTSISQHRPREDDDANPADSVAPPVSSSELALASFPVVEGQPTLVVVSSSAATPQQGYPPASLPSLVAWPLPPGTHAPTVIDSAAQQHCPGHLLHMGSSIPPAPYVPIPPSAMSSSSQSIHTMLMQRFSQGYVLEYERRSRPAPGAVSLPIPSSIPPSRSGLHNCFLCQRPVMLAMTTASPVVAMPPPSGATLPMPPMVSGPLPPMQSLPTALAVMGGLVRLLEDVYWLASRFVNRMWAVQQWDSRQRSSRLT